MVPLHRSHKQQSRRLTVTAFAKQMIELGMPKRALAKLVCLTVAISFSQLIPSLLVKQIMDGITGGWPLWQINIYGGSMIATAFLMAILTWLQLTNQYKVIGWLFCLNIELDSLKKTFELPVATLRVNHGKRKTMIRSGQKAILSTVYRLFTNILPISVVVVLGFILIAWRDLWCAFAILLSIAGIMWQGIVVYRKFLFRLTRYSAIESQNEASYEEIFDNAVLIKMLAKVKVVLHGYSLDYKRSEKIGRATFNSFLLQAFLRRDSWPIACFGFIVFRSNYLLYHHKISLGDFSMVMSLNTTLTVLALSVGSMYRDQQYDWSKISKLDRYRNNAGAQSFEKTGMYFKGLTGDIVYDHVTVVGRVSDVSFRIKPKTWCMIVGPSGSGKTTLVRLLSGPEPIDGGSIAIGGTDYRRLNDTLMHHRMGILDQSARLLNKTLAYNILLGHDSDFGPLSEEKERELYRMCDIEHLWDRRFKEVGVNGSNLSGGEQIRVKLARALVNEPDVLILDEATSGLDPETEQLVFQTIKNIMARRQCLAIEVTHRYEHALDADMIVMLNRKGQIVPNGVGTPSEVLAKCEAFQRMRALERATQTLAAESSV